MSLVQYAVYQATGIALPGDGSQPEGGRDGHPPGRHHPQDTASLLPGDAVYWGGSGIDGFAHSGVYAGGGDVWDAIGVDQPVQEHSMTYLARSTHTTAPSGTGHPSTATSGGLMTRVVGLASTPDGTATG